MKRDRGMGNFHGFRWNYSQNSSGYSSSFPLSKGRLPWSLARREQSCSKVRFSCRRFFVLHSMVVVIVFCFGVGIILWMPRRWRFERNLREKRNKRDEERGWSIEYLLYFNYFSFLIHRFIVNIETILFILQRNRKRDWWRWKGDVDSTYLRFFFVLIFIVVVVVIVNVMCTSASERSHVECLSAMTCITTVIRIHCMTDMCN